MNASIAVLGKYNDIFEGFRASAERYATGIDKVLVRDGHGIPDPAGWRVVQGPETFSMAGNGNLAWKACEGDILYCGDDVRFLEDKTVDRLSEISHSDASIGILSPKIVGGVGNALQGNPNGELVYSSARLAFVCVYIKREVVERVGYMDERFSGYGFDDDDYCRRVMDAGYKLAVTNRVSVSHEHANSTFKRSGVNVGSEMERTRRIYEQKWAHV